MYRVKLQKWRSYSGGERGRDEGKGDRGGRDFYKMCKYLPPIFQKLRLGGGEHCLTNYTLVVKCSI